MCTHLARYSVGVLLSLQAQDFSNLPQVQCTASRMACTHTCFQRCFEFQPSIITTDSSALSRFLLRVCLCLLFRGVVVNVRGRTVWIPRLQKFAAIFLVLQQKYFFSWKKIQTSFYGFLEWTCIYLGGLSTKGNSWLYTCFPLHSPIWSSRLRSEKTCSQMRKSPVDSYLS